MEEEKKETNDLKVVKEDQETTEGSKTDTTEKESNVIHPFADNAVNFLDEETNELDEGKLEDYMNDITSKITDEATKAGQKMSQNINLSEIRGADRFKMVTSMMKPMLNSALGNFPQSSKFGLLNIVLLLVYVFLCGVANIIHTFITNPITLIVAVFIVIVSYTIKKYLTFKEKNNENGKH